MVSKHPVLLPGRDIRILMRDCIALEESSLGMSADTDDVFVFLVVVKIPDQNQLHLSYREVAVFLPAVLLSPLVKLLFEMLPKLGEQMASYLIGEDPFLLVKGEL